jgi:uncharacterized protein (TIGR03437 family)
MSTGWAQLSIGPQTGYTGGALVVPVAFSAGSVAVSAIQFDLIYPSGLSLSAVPGNGMQAGQKSLYTADVSPTQKRFVIVGLNQQIIPDGVLLDLTFGIAASVAPGDYPLKFTAVVASAPDGTAAEVAGQDGTITMQNGSSNGPSAYNAASMSPGPVAPGEIVTLLGSGLRPTAAGPLSDTTVLANGARAPVLYAETGQINAVMPFELAGQSSANIVINYQNRQVAQIVMPVAPAVPGIFSMGASGAGQGAVLNQDYAQNSGLRPADRGSTVMLFATGAGVMAPALSNGQVVSTAAPFPVPNLPVSVTIGGIPATVSYAGAAPGMIAGVLQVNCIVPADVAPGASVPVTLQIGGASSQANLTMAIK